MQQHTMSTSTPAPSGIEAAVCEDIARRQQLGIAKYGVTVADNPLALPAWLRHAYEKALDLAIYLRRTIAALDQGAKLPDITATVGAVQAAAPGTQSQHRTIGRHLYMGRSVSIADLARMAGCDWNCMSQRLRHRTPEEAVAMGPAGAPGVRRGPRTAIATKARVAGAKRFAYQGQQLTAAELAALAGTTAHQMQLRLRSKNAEDAVALGPARPRAKNKKAAKPQPATGARLSTPVNPAAMPLRQQAPFKPEAAVVVPANVKRTVAPPMPDRFAVAAAPAHFAAQRPGQYDEDAAHTPLARGLAGTPKP